METTLVQARVNVRRARNVARILQRVGMKPADAVNMLFAQIELRQGLPFVPAIGDDGYLPHVPNAETRAALREKPARRFKTVGALRKWLDDEND
jgi:antitoxin component of RelBE/YafQ-DinJ toxin-antitoxin module